ncbi:MAG: DUF3841 domain-containing protein [Tissierellia bacterium]|nr:DUF3841 domain-containing protein [Tissierellia bacterium]
MEKINLYTKQHIKSLEVLKETGVIINKEEYVRKHMMDIFPMFSFWYGKFIEMAEKRIPRPAHTEYPLWCSVSQKNCMKPDEISVVYCLQVPKDRIIYFDSMKWDRVLNNLYIPKDEKDWKDFQNEIKELGVKDEFNFIMGRYKGMFPHIEKKIIDSWERIFDIDHFDEFQVQANIWEIKEEWIRHVVCQGEDLFEIAKDMIDDY